MMLNAGLAFLEPLPRLQAHAADHVPSTGRVHHGIGEIQRHAALGLSLPVARMQLGGAAGSPPRSASTVRSFA